LKKAAEASEVIEYINGLSIPKPKLDQHHAGETPGITRGGGECGWEP